MKKKKLKIIRIFIIIKKLVLTKPITPFQIYIFIDEMTLIFISVQYLKDKKKVFN